MPGVKDIISDPNFHALPVAAREHVLSQVDPNFAGLPPEARSHVIGQFEQRFNQTFAPPVETPLPELPELTTTQKAQGAIGEFLPKLEDAAAQSYDRTIAPWRGAAGAATNITLGTAAGGLQAAGALAEKLPVIGDLVGPPMQQAGKAVSDFNADISERFQPNNPDDWVAYWLNVAGSGVGSMVPFVAGALATGGVGVPALLTGSGADALVSGALAYDDAKRAGASDGDAAAAAAEVAAGTAATNVVAGRLGAFAEGAGKLRRVAGGAIGESLQEGAQTGVENLAAQIHYDPDRPLGQGVPEGMAGGLFGGGLVGGGVAAMERGSQAPPVQDSRIADAPERPLLQQIEVPPRESTSIQPETHDSAPPIVEELQAVYESLPPETQEKVDDVISDLVEPEQPQDSRGNFTRDDLDEVLLGRRIKKYAESADLPAQAELAQPEDTPPVSTEEARPLVMDEGEAEYFFPSDESKPEPGPAIPRFGKNRQRRSDATQNGDILNQPPIQEDVDSIPGGGEFKALPDKVLKTATPSETAPPVRENYPVIPESPTRKESLQVAAAAEKPVAETILDVNAVKGKDADPYVPGPQARTTPDMKSDMASGAAFTTSQGSTYTFRDGKTQRNKAPHAGHDPSDVGQKRESEQTLFVDPADSQEIGAWNTLSSSNKRIVVKGDKIILTSRNPKTGKQGRDKIIPVRSREPQAGLSPVELWDKSSQGEGWWKSNHPGNEIVSVENRPAPVENQSPGGQIPAADPYAPGSQARLKKTTQSLRLDRERGGQALQEAETQYEPVEVVSREGKAVRIRRADGKEMKVSEAMLAPAENVGTSEQEPTFPNTASGDNGTTSNLPASEARESETPAMEARVESTREIEPFTRDEIQVGKPRRSTRKRANGVDGEVVTEISAPSSILDEEVWHSLADTSKTKATVEGRIDYETGKSPKKTDKVWTVYGRSESSIKPNVVADNLTYNDAIEAAKDYVEQSKGPRDTRGGFVGDNFVMEGLAKVRDEAMEQIADKASFHTEKLGRASKKAWEWQHFFWHTPGYIADKFSSFKPVFERARQMFHERNGLASRLGEDMRPYLALDPDEREELDKRLIAARLDKTNDIDEQGLSEKQLAAFKGLRKMFDQALSQLEDLAVDLATKGQITSAADIETLEDLKKALGERSGDGSANQGFAERTYKILEDVRRTRREGYVPFSRFGDWKYGIVPTKGDGPVIHWEARDSKRRAEKRVEQLKKQYASELASGEYRLVEPRQDEKLDAMKESGLGAYDLWVLWRTVGLDPELKAALGEEVEESLKRLGFKAHFTETRDTPGYETDLLRPIQDYVTGLSGHIARAKFARDSREAFNRISDKKVKLKGYAQKYIDYVLNPGNEAGWLRSSMFYWHLGLNPKAAVVNLSQVPLLTIPWLSQYAKTGRVATEVTKAMKDTMAAVRLGGDGTLLHIDYDALPEDVREDVRKAQQEGELLAQFAREIGEGARGRQANKGLDRAKRMAGQMFAGTEHVNRLTTFIAAHRLYSKGLDTKSEGGGFKDALSFADDAVSKTQFEYAAYNRAIFQRGWGAPLAVFKSYTVNYIEAWQRLAQKAKSGEDKMRARKAMGLMYAAMQVMAGALGIPLAEDLLELLFLGLGGVTGKKYNAEVETKKLAEALIGEDMADFMLHGATRFTPIDLSRSIGQGSPIGVRDIAQGRASDTITILGTGKDIAEGAQGVLQKDPRKMESLLPTGLKGRAKAARYEKEGLRTRSGEKIPMEPLTDTELMFQSMGFTPTKVSKTYEQAAAVRNVGEKTAGLRSNFIKRLATAKALHHDREEYQAILKEIRSYNATATPIDQIELDEAFRISVDRKANEMRKPGERSLIEGVPRNKRRYALEEMRK